MSKLHASTFAFAFSMRVHEIFRLTKHVRATFFGFAITTLGLVLNAEAGTYLTNIRGCDQPVLPGTPFGLIGSNEVEGFFSPSPGIVSYVYRAQVIDNLETGHIGGSCQNLIRFRNTERDLNQARPGWQSPPRDDFFLDRWYSHLRRYVESNDNTKRGTYRMPTHALGIRGSLFDGMFATTASPAQAIWMMDFAGLDTLEVPFIVTKAGADDWLAVYIDNELMWNEELAKFDLDTLYSASFALGTFAGKWGAVSVFIHSLGTGMSQVFIPTATLEFASDVVPLPAALPLLAAGLSAMGLMGWRRKRKETQNV